MLLAVRTTVTLDPDTDAYGRRLMRERGISFKQAVNAGRPATPPELPTFRMGPPKIDLTKALRLAGRLEDEAALRRVAEGRWRGRGRRGRGHV